MSEYTSFFFNDNWYYRRLIIAQSAKSLRQIVCVVVNLTIEGPLCCQKGLRIC